MPSDIANGRPTINSLEELRVLLNDEIDRHYEHFGVTA
jgi:hypothetical protein